MQRLAWITGMTLVAVGMATAPGCGNDTTAFGSGGSGATQGTGASGAGTAQGGGVAAGGAGQGGTFAQGGGTAQGGAGQGGAGLGGAGQGGAGECGPCGNQVCDPQLGCVDCLNDGDCSMQQPICVLGSCEECGKNADCPPMELCNPATHQCQSPCNGNQGCNQGPADICDPNTGLCVECLNDNQCGGDQLCSPDGVCVDCLSNNDCGNNNPICDPTQGQCVECVFNGDCNGDPCIDNECGG
ncbi:MAG: hypothetical protein R3B72_26060 [Polyangiaceae bacterium]